MPGAFHWSFFLHFLLTAILNSIISGQDSTLKLVQLVYRHGDRSPSMTFPKDEWKEYWKDGLEQLTNLGKQQQYALGQYFRQRYGHLLNSTYKSEEIKVRSTDKDRTLMSAYLNLAGLFPPLEDQIWNQNILWQPIPVHTVPDSEDRLLLSPILCPKYDIFNKTVHEFPEMKAASVRLEKLGPFLSNATGISLTTALQIEDLHDFYHILQMHNLSTPSWTDTVMKEIEIFQETRDSLLKKYPESFKLRGGLLLNEMLGNMENKIAGNLTKKVFMYSGHDHSVFGLLQVLQVYNDINPSYCSTVMVELHQDDKNDSFVQVFYRNSTSDEPLQLYLPKCASPCPFQLFKDLTANMVVNDYVQACKATNTTQ